MPMLAKFAAAVTAALNKTGLMDALSETSSTPSTSDVPNFEYPGDNCC